MYTLNYKDISQATQLSLSTVKRFFSPKGNPSLKTAIKIAAHFNITLNAVNELRNIIITKKEEDNE
jgi:DNA-binding phage protein